MGVGEGEVKRLLDSDSARAACLTAAGNVGCWSWDAATNMMIVDQAMAAMVGFAGHGLRTLDELAMLCEDGEQGDLMEVFRSAASGTGYLHRVCRISAGEELRYLELRGARMVVNDATIVRGVALDVTERYKAETALRISEAHFQAMTNSIDQMIWSTLPDGHHDFFNERWYDFTGVPRGSTDGEGWSTLFHPDDQQRAWKTWRRSLETGKPYHIEYRLRHHSGEYRWVIGRAQCVRNGDGEIVRWYGTCTDIHDLKVAEEARELIARELSHRIKNIFSVVTSLVLLPTRDRPELKPFAEQVQERINALAKAHEYVRPHSADSGAPEAPPRVHGLLQMLLEPYGSNTSNRIGIRGQDAEVGTRAATALALLIHELATNAVKYGSLSSDKGKVEVECRRDDSLFLIHWKESGGPSISSPTSVGFGTKLTDRVITAQLEAQVERSFKPQGLEVGIRIPMTSLVR